MFNQGHFNLERGTWDCRQILDFESNLIYEIVDSWSRLLHYFNQSSCFSYKILDSDPLFWKFFRYTGCPVNWYSLSISIPDFSDGPIQKS